MEEVNEFLSRIRSELINFEILANIFFFFNRPTEDILKRYSFRNKSTRISFCIDFLLSIPRILIAFSVSIAISLLRVREGAKFKLDSISKRNTLILSHYTPRQNPRIEDVFFSPILDCLDANRFFLNSTRKFSHLIEREYASAGVPNVVANTKTLPIWEMVWLHFNQSRLTFILLKSAWVKTFLTYEQRRLLVRGAIYQHRRGTVANLVMKRRLQSVIEKAAPERLVLTIEGHAHEHVILQMRKLLFPQIKIIGFQHAPIVPGQLSLFNLLQNFTSRDSVLLSGNIPKELISRHVPNLHVKIVGSPKYLKPIAAINKPEKCVVLGAVEATHDSVKTFFELFGYLAANLPEFGFKLRFHPDISVKITKRILRRLSTFENLELSSSSLENDLVEAKFIIFRSSAVAIQGLSRFAIPIHFDSIAHGLMNPLSGTVFQDFSYEDPTQILEYFRNFDYVRYSKIVKQSDFLDTSLNYFSAPTKITQLI